MTYDEHRCYWCGKELPINKKTHQHHAFSSLATDTIRTQRNFCSKKHLELFKKTAKGKKTSLKLKPYYGGEED